MHTVYPITYVNVFAESLRKWPPIFQLDRVCVKEYVISPKNDGEKSLTIKKGTQIIFPSIGVHYDPNYFPHPEKFDPDRFNEENKLSIVHGSYMPFGVGPRNCIGKTECFLCEQFKKLCRFRFKIRLTRSEDFVFLFAISI